MVVNNADEESGVVTVALTTLGIEGAASMRDLWTHTNNGTLMGNATFDRIPAHGGIMVLLTPTAAAYV